jgi:branched-chain amino acid transport system substrate-binding protein
MKAAIIAILSFLLLFAACATEPTGNVAADSAKEPIKIGFIGPLSGSMSSWGAAERDGVALAIKEINAAGGINGRNVEIVYEDDSCEAKKSTTAMNKLTTVDHVVAVVGTICSSTTLADAPIAEAQQTVLISIGSSNPSITTAGDYVFRVWPSDAYNGQILADYVYAQGNRRAAMLIVNNDYGIGVSDVFERSFVTNGGAIVAKETYVQGSADHRASLTKIAQSSPDAIIVIQNDEAPAIHRQMADLGITQPVYGTESYDVPSLVVAAKGTMEGVTYSMPAFDESTTGVADFKVRYEKEFGTQPQQAIVAVYAYDATNMIIDGLKQDPTGKTLKDYLYTIKNRQTVGGIISFDHNGDVVRDFAIKRIVDGKVIEVQ